MAIAATPEKKRRPAAPERVQQRSESVAGFAQDTAEALGWQQVADESPQVQRTVLAQRMADRGPHGGGTETSQRAADGALIPTVQGDLGDLTSGEPVQGMFGWLKKLVKKESPDEKSLLGSGSRSDSGLESEPQSDVETETNASLDLGFGSVDYEDGESALTIPILGQDVKLGTAGASVSGSISESVSVSPVDVSLGIDIPIPAPLPAYITAGITAGVGFGLEVKGSYEVASSSEGQQVDVNAHVSGTAAMEVTANLGGGAGVPNLVGLEAGMFAGAGGKLDVTGSLAGSVTRDPSKAGYKTSSLTMTLSSNAALTGSAGTYLRAKFGPFSATKNFTFKEWTFAEWAFERQRILQKEGLMVSDVRPTVSDFKLLFGSKSYDDIWNEPYDGTTPLLSGYARSDD
jgi:hypothetical protein